VAATDTHLAINAVWRIESARLIAGLTRLVRDVGLAEELAQEALVAALEQWPKSGVPDKPGAWLMATAKHRAIDQIRRSALYVRKQDELGREIEARSDRIAFVHVLAEPDEAWSGERGFITADIVRRHCDPLDGRHWFVCGPPAMVDAMRIVTDELAIPNERLHFELFAGYQ
jgi:hypothetical protein